MKYTNLLFYLLIALFISACSDDNNEPNNGNGGGNGGGGNETPERTDIQAWIEDTMDKNYYWDIPTKLDYSKTDPKEFFTSLLSKEDGKENYYYSYIEDVSQKSRSSIKEDYTYGFEFMGIYRNNARTEIQALVLYVLENSPANKAGLQRGDWIIEINGSPITNSNYTSLFGAGACELTIERWDSERGGFVTQPDKITMESARKVEDHPVYLAKVLETHKNKKKVGYLVYNHFTDGKGDGDTSYDKKLREVSKTFHDSGVEEFVLDLRYNNGGLLSCAMVLSAILAPENAFGKEFVYLQYKNGSKTSYPLSRDRYLTSTGMNLNLKKLYVLTSNSTASASEMIISGFHPVMGETNVIVIGQTTEGKNVGSSPYTSDDKQWIMHPIIAKIFNSVGFSDYANGFEPDYELDEAYVPVGNNTVRPIEVLPLGDPNERLLYAAMALIDGTAIADRSTRSLEEAGKVYPKASIHSIDRRASNGVIIEE